MNDSETDAVLGLHAADFHFLTCWNLFARPVGKNDPIDDRLIVLVATIDLDPSKNLRYYSRSVHCRTEAKWMAFQTESLRSPATSAYAGDSETCKTTTEMFHNLTTSATAYVQYLWRQIVVT